MGKTNIQFYMIQPKPNVYKNNPIKTAFFFCCKSPLLFYVCLIFFVSFAFTLKLMLIFPYFLSSSDPFLGWLDWQNWLDIMPRTVYHNMVFWDLELKIQPKIQQPITKMMPLKQPLPPQLGPILVDHDGET